MSVIPGVAVTTGVTAWAEARGGRLGVPLALASRRFCQTHARRRIKSEPLASSIGSTLYGPPQMKPVEVDT